MLRMIVAVICLALVCTQAFAASDRVDIEGLVTAAPLPEGFTVTRHDATQGEQIMGHYLLLQKDDSPTKVLVQIERREVAARPARVATLKAYVNAAAATWQERGWAVRARSLPKIEEIDFSKPVAVDLDATKAGESPLAIHLEVIFDRFAYQVLSLSTDDAQLREMIRWSQTVRPVQQAPATRPAR